MSFLPQLRFWLTISLLVTTTGCATQQKLPFFRPSSTTPLSVPPEAVSTRLTTIPQPPAECPENSRGTYQRLEDIFESKKMDIEVDVNTLDRQVLAALGTPQYSKRDESGITYEWMSPDCPGWYIHASFNSNSHAISTAEIPPPAATIPTQDSTSGLRYTLVGHPREVEALAITPDGQMLISGSADGQIHFWRSSDGRHIRKIKADDWVTDVKVSSDGKTLLGLGSDLTTWDMAMGNLSQQWEFTNGGSIQNFFSPNQSVIVSNINDERVDLWSIETRKRVASFSQSPQRMGKIALHSSQRILADAENGGWGVNQNRVRLWDLPSGRKVQTLAGHNYLVRAMLFSPNGEVLATGGEAEPLRKPPVSEIKLWDWRKGILIRTLKADVNGIRSMMFSRDGQRLVTGSGNGSIDIWDVSTGKRLRSLTGHTNAVVALTLDATGRLLVSGSDDRTVKVWQLN